MADSIFVANTRSKLKNILYTNFVVTFFLILLSISLSCVLQFANFSFLNPCIYESFIIPFFSYSSPNFLFEHYSLIFSYDIEVIRKTMIFVAATYMLSFFIVFSAIYSLNIVYTKEDLKFIEFILGALRSLKASFVTKLFITIIDLAYIVSVVSLSSFLLLWLETSQIEIVESFAIILTGIGLGVLIVFRYCIRVVLVLGLVASVTEKSCGVSAIRKAMKMVEGRKRLAFSFSYTTYMLCSAVFYLITTTALAEEKMLVVRVGRKIVSVIVFAMLDILIVAVHLAYYYEVKEKLEAEELDINEASYARLTDDSSVAKPTQV